MSELVFSEDLSKSVIAAENISICDSSDTENGSQEEIEIETPSTSTQKSGNNKEEMRTLFHATMILHGKIKEYHNFYQSWPPTPSEFTTTNAEKMVPPGLSVFLSWLLGFSSTVSMSSYLNITANEYLSSFSCPRYNLCKLKWQQTDSKISIFGYGSQANYRILCTYKDP
jgi:hypothetical protein